MESDFKKMIRGRRGGISSPHVGEFEGLYTPLGYMISMGRLSRGWIKSSPRRPLLIFFK